MLITHITQYSSTQADSYQDKVFLNLTKRNP